MIGWIEGIQNAIEYIEKNLTEELNIQEIAEKACVSAFYFQKVFNALCGFTVGEYIRNRRLSVAAQELSKSDARVIDVAIKYGYDSPDSFTRAFTKFHGISPSAAKLKGTNLKYFAPLRIKLMLEGGTMLEYKIVEKAQFTVMGKVRGSPWKKHWKSNRIRERQIGLWKVIRTRKAGFFWEIKERTVPWLIFTGRPFA